MALAEVGEVTLFHTDEGSGGPPLLLVHGYACDSNDWIWQLAHFAQRRRVIAVDLRGHGRSSAPDGGYGAVQMADDLAGLLDLLGVPQVVAVGHSMGGVVVSALAVEHPGMVAGLVCVDPAYLLPDETESLTAPVAVAFGQADPGSVVQDLFSGFQSAALAAPLRAWHLRRAAGVPGHVLRQAFESQVTGLSLISHSRPYLARRTCPVLSFYADPARSPVEAELFVDPRSRVVYWEGSGHWLHQERPEEFNALVDSWLAGIS